MTIIARIDVEGGPSIEGRGASEADAIKNCLQNTEQHLELFVELSPKVRLPLSVADRIPSNLPWPERNLPLIIFERCSHYDGKPYEWRFIAPRHPVFLKIENGSAVGCEVEDGETQIWEGTKGPVLISTLDGITITYQLTAWSMEYVNGEWILQNPPSGLCSIKYAS